jgi:hypothetical protein
MTTMQRIISNSDDVIDSRDVIARIDDLEGQLADALDAGDTDAEVEINDELVPLKSLADESSDYAADWQYGEQLIRDTYFETFAEELAEDIGAIDSNATWPLNCIDWEQAASDLQMDYTSVEFDGVTYWIR